MSNGVVLRYFTGWYVIETLSSFFFFFTRSSEIQPLHTNAPDWISVLKMQKSTE